MTPKPLKQAHGFASIVRILQMLLTWRSFSVLRRRAILHDTGTPTYPACYSIVALLHKHLSKTNTQIFKTCSFNTGWGEHVWKPSKSLRFTGIEMPFELAIRPIVVFAFSFYSQQSKVQNTRRLLQYSKQVLNYSVKLEITWNIEHQQRDIDTEITLPITPPRRKMHHWVLGLNRRAKSASRHTDTGVCTAGLAGVVLMILIGLKRESAFHKGRLMSQSAFSLSVIRKHTLQVFTLILQRFSASLLRRKMIGF